MGSHVLLLIALQTSVLPVSPQFHTAMVLGSGSPPNITEVKLKLEGLVHRSGIGVVVVVVTGTVVVVIGTVVVVIGTVVVVIGTVVVVTGTLVVVIGVELTLSIAGPAFADGAPCSSTAVQ